MDKAREILEQMPDVKIGLDSFYGRQTVLNALNKALNIHNVVRQSEQFKCQQEFQGIKKCPKQCIQCNLVYRSYSI